MCTKRQSLGQCLQISSTFDPFDFDLQERLQLCAFNESCVYFDSKHIIFLNVYLILLQDISTASASALDVTGIHACKK